jgi:hypothetical protein
MSNEGVVDLQHPHSGVFTQCRSTLLADIVAALPAPKHIVGQPTVSRRHVIGPATKERPTSRLEGVSKATCRFSPRPHKAETGFSSMPETFSILEAHLSEEQVRERLAAGLWSIFEMDDI